MKKKHRDITVDGVKYGWITDPIRTSAEGAKLNTRVFKDKKEWFSFESAEQVLPSAVKLKIQKQLAK